MPIRPVDPYTRDSGQVAYKNNNTLSFRTLVWQHFEDDFLGLFRTWLKTDKTFLNAVKRAQKDDVLMSVWFSSAWYDLKPGVRTALPGHWFDECPMKYEQSPKVISLWVFRGQFYEPQDAGLCQFCENQLTCSLEGKPRGLFRSAAPPPKPEPRSRKQVARD